jgi:hypothetical protein
VCAYVPQPASRRDYFHVRSARHRVATALASVRGVVDPELQRVQEQLVAASHQLAAYEHVRATRERLARDLGFENARVQHLSNELARERHDVVERQAGVMGFLYGLLGDEQLTIEQREAIEAEARLAEAMASRNHLQAQVAALDAQLAGQSGQALAAAVASARAHKEEVLIRTHDPAGLALQDLAVRIEAIEIELLPLEQAVTAGEHALARLQAVIDRLDRARTEQLEQRDARGSAGEAQAAITVFHRAVDGLATAEEATWGFLTLITEEDRAPFVDGWIRALVGNGDRSARLATARSAIAARRARVHGQLARIRARRDELAPRREALLAERQRLLT